MTAILKNYKFHLTAGTAAVIIIFLLTFGLSAGSYKTQVEEHGEKIEELEKETRKIPVIEQQIENIEQNTKDIKGSVDRIENILLKTK